MADKCVDMSTRSRIVGFGSAALLVVAGIAVVVGFAGTFGQVLALFAGLARQPAEAL
jgi:hypothetical protein